MKSKISIAVIAIVYLVAFLHFGFWKQAPYGGDTWGYYVHLPSVLLYGDVGDYEASSEAWREYNPSSNDPRDSLHISPIGKRVVKYPVGVAIMEVPFFSLGHIYCWATDTPMDGYSWPYLFFTGISTAFFAIWGIWILLLVLKPYFKDENIRIAVAITIGLATNLFYSSTYTVGMSHPYLFFLYAVLLLGTIRFYDQPSTKRAIWVGAAAGGIALTRSPEVICVLIPLLWGINNWAAVGQRLRFVGTHIGKIGWAILAFLLMLVPQALYWKFVSGQFWFNGYQGEYFTWANPKILDGLINYKNGWLIYTPVMVFALLGLLVIRRYAADALTAILCFLPLHLYIIYSWWCWNYINGFGSRPMIEILPLLAFPLAAFFSLVSKRKWAVLLGSILLAFFIWLNLFQTWQVTQGLMLSESTNSAYYWAIFGKSKSNDNAAITYFTHEKQPELIRSGWQKWGHGSFDTLSMVRLLGTNDMEDSTEALFTRALKKNGDFSFRCDAEFSPGCYMETDTMDVKPGDYLRIAVSSFVKGNEMVFEHDKQALLVVHLFAPDGETISYAQLAVSSRTLNTKASIWYTGAAGLWGEAAYFIQIPETFKPGDRIKTYVWNTSRQRIYLDDMRVELWRYH